MAEYKADYGISKDAGGDSKENVSKMETCVGKVMQGGKSKDSAIRICKTSIFGSASGVSESEVAAAQMEQIGAELVAIGKVLSKKNLDAIKKCIDDLERLVGLVEPNESQAAEAIIKIQDGNLVIAEPANPVLHFSTAPPDIAHSVMEKAKFVPMISFME